MSQEQIHAAPVDTDTEVPEWVYEVGGLNPNVVVSPPRFDRVTGYIYPVVVTERYAGAIATCLGLCDDEGAA